jgi:hypothetical protein
VIEPYEKASHDLDVAQAALQAAKGPAWLAAVSLGCIGGALAGWLALPLIAPAAYLLLTAPHKRRMQSAHDLAKRLHDGQTESKA